MWKWVGLGAALCVFCACQNKPNSLSAPISTADTTFKMQMPQTTVASAQLTDLLNLSVVTCEGGAGACPEAVGSVLTWAQDEKQPNHLWTYQCTGFLVASDIIATNSHCIPLAVRQHPGLCSTYVGIKFPALGDHATETQTCAQLIQASEIPNVDLEKEMRVRFLDYAFFRLQQPSKRQPLVLSRRGVKNDAPLTIYVSDPVIGKKPDSQDRRLYTVIRKKQCESKQGTVVFTDYDNDFADFAFGLGDKCRFAKGNSGSPVLDNSGEVVALLFAKSNGLTDEVEQYLRKNGASGQPEKFADNGFFINLSCLDTAKEVGLGPKASECAARDQLQKAGENRADQNAVKDENAEIQRMSDEWLKTAPRLFRYRPLRQIDTNASHQTVVTWKFQLKCLLPQEYWKDSAPLSHSRMTVKYTAPVDTYQMHVDDSGRAENIRISSHIAQIMLNLNTSLVGASDSVVGTQTVDGLSTSFSTHWCSSQEISSL